MYAWKLPSKLTIGPFLSKTAQLLAPCRRILFAKRRTLFRCENLSSTRFFSENISCSPKVLLWPGIVFARDGSSCSRVMQCGWIKQSEAWGGTLMCSQECTGEVGMRIALRMQFRERHNWLFVKWANVSMPLKSGTLWWPNTYGSTLQESASFLGTSRRVLSWASATNFRHGRNQ